MPLSTTRWPGRSGSSRGSSRHPLIALAGEAFRQQDLALGRLDVDLPVVVAEKGMRVIEHLLGVQLDGSNVQPAGVVGVDGAGHVLRGSVGVQVPTRGEDGIPRIVDVAPT